MISSVKNTLSNYRSVIWSDASGYGRKFDKRAAFKRLAHKYEHPENLSRITLVEYIRKSSILLNASPEVREIFELMESPKGHPKQASQRIETLITAINRDPLLTKYVDQLRQCFTISTLQRLCSIFTKFNLAKFESSEYFTFTDKQTALRLIPDGNRDGLFNIKISTNDEGSFLIFDTRKTVSVSTMSSILRTFTSRLN